jgi:hypothetical protein
MSTFTQSIHGMPKGHVLSYDYCHFISELKEVIEKLVLERDNLASQVDDLKQVTEAAKRERVLAIDEKDHLLRE